MWKICESSSSFITCLWHSNVQPLVWLMSLLTFLPQIGRDMPLAVQHSVLAVSPPLVLTWCLRQIWAVQNSSTWKFNIESNRSLLQAARDPFVWSMEYSFKEWEEAKNKVNQGFFYALSWCNDHDGNRLVMFSFLSRRRLKCLFV